MALGWELVIPLPASLSFIILVLLVSGILEVFSWCRSQKQVAPKTKASKQQTQKLTASEAEEARLRFIGNDEVMGISGLNIDWTQEYALWTVYKRLGRILRQLENARETLVEQSLHESQTVSSSSVSDFVAQKVVSPGYCCKKGKRYSEYSTSSGSSNISSSLSSFPVLYEGTTLQFHSNSGPVSPPKAPSVSGNQGTPQSTFKMTDPENSGFFQDLSVLPPLHGPNSILNESPGPPVRSPLQLSPSVRGDLEGHISWKASALQKKLVPLPVKKSLEMLNDLAEVPGVSEQESPKTQLPIPVPQRAEESTYRSPGVSSFHLLKKDPKHLSEQSIEQRVIGLPEKRVQPQKAQVPKVELTPKMPYSAKDSMKVTPLPLRQVVDLMGISPEAHSEVIKSVRFFPKPLTPGQSHQDMDSSKFTPWRKELGCSKDLATNEDSSITSPRCMEHIHSAAPQDLQGDINMVELTPRPSLEDTKSVNLAPKQCSQNISSDKVAHITVLEDMKASLVEGTSLIPEALVETVKVGELIPSTHLDAVKLLEVSPNSSHHIPEPEGLTLQQQASKVRVTPATCHQMVESLELTRSSLAMTPAPLTPNSESMEMSLSPLQEGLETQAVKGRKETPESRHAVKNTPDLLPKSEVTNINSEGMAPEPQPPDVKLARVTLESDSEVTNSSEITLRSEHKNPVNIRLILPKLDHTQGTTAETYSEVGSLGLTLEPGARCERSESLAQNLKSSELSELTSEPSTLVVEPTELTTGPKPHIKDVIPRPQLHKVGFRQLDTESQFSHEQSVSLTQLSSRGVVEPEKANPETWLQGSSLKELIKGTQPPKVKSMNLNVGLQQPIVNSGLIPGPQLQSIRFQNSYQGLNLQRETPVNLISDPSYHPVRPDDVTSFSPQPGIRLTDFFSDPKALEAQPHHVTPVEVNQEPCLQTVKISDLTPEPKHHGFKNTQFIPGVLLQERKSQGFIPQSLRPLRQEPPALPTEGQDLSRMKSATQTSELRYPSGLSLGVSPRLWQQDTKFSDLAPGPKLEGVKFGKQSTGLVLTGVTSETPQLVTHVPKLTKMTPGLQDTRQANFNSGPLLKDVKFFDAPRTQLQGVKIPQLNLGPQLESVKLSEWTKQTERQRMKPELTVQESLFRGIKHVTGNQVPGFEDKMPCRVACDPQIANAGSMRLTSGINLAHADHSELIRRPQAQGIGSSELIQGPVEVSKQEKLTAVEITSGPNLEAMKSMQLRSSSELGQVKCMLSAAGMQAGDRKQDRESVILTPGQCLGRIKSTVVSPSSSQPVDIKTVSISGSRIKDLKIVGLFGDIQPQDANAMGFKHEPQKLGEHPVTSVSGVLSQENPMEGAQGPQLQGIKPKAVTSQPQITDRKHAVTSCLEQQSLKPGAVAKIQEIQGMEFAGLASKQQRQGMEPIDLTPVPGQDGQILINSPDWKCGTFNQLNKQFDSDQESKPADVKSREINSKVQFKDLSFELAPKPAVHRVEGNEQQHGVQVPSVKPCQLTPAPQIHQAKVSELRSQQQWPGVKTVLLTTESQTGSTKSTQWIPISEFQNEKRRESNLKSQSQGVGPTEPEPSTQWRGVKSSELTDRSKDRGEKSVAFHLEPQLQQVKTSLLAIGLQKPKTFNLTSEPQPQGLETAEVTKEPRVESIRSIQWIPGPEFHGAKFLGLNCGLSSQGVKSTERKQSTLLGVGKPPEVILEPKHQGKKSVDFKPESELKREENRASTSEPQPQGVKNVPLQYGTQLENTKPVQWSPLSDFQLKKSMLNLGVQSIGITHKELKPSAQLIDEKTSDPLTTRPKIQGIQPSVPADEYSSHKFKSIDFNFELQFKRIKPCDPALRSKVSDIKSATVKPRFHCEDRNSAELTPGIQPQEVKPLGSCPGTQPQDVTSLVLKPESQSSQVKRGVFSQRPQSQNNKNTELKSAKVSELALQTKPQGRKPELQSGSQWQRAKCPDLTPETKSQKMKCVELSHSSPLEGKSLTDLTMETKIQNEIKPNLKLEGEKPDSTPKKLILGTRSVGLDSRPHLQESKYPELVMGTELQGADAMGQHFASIKSSQVVTPTKSQSGTSVNFNFGPQTLNKNPFELVQGKNIEPSQVCTETKLLDDSSLEFKHEPRLQGRKSNDWSHCKNVMSPNTGMEDADSSELHPGPDLQGIKSKVFYLGPHFKDVNSACFPNADSQYINSSRCTPGSHWQASKSACVPEPKPQCINSVCTPASHLHGMNSSTCLSGSKLHCIDSTGCNSKARFQDVNSSASSLGSSPQCAKSAECKPEAHLQSVGHSTSVPSVPIESRDQIINYVSVSPKPLDQMLKSALIPKPLFLTAKSDDLAPGPCPQVIEPIGVTTSSSIKVKECLDLLPRPHLQEQETPMELTPRATVEMNSAEFILQQTSPLEEPTVLTREQRLHAERSLGLKTESPKAMEIEDLNEELVCPNSNKEMMTSEKLQAENYFSRVIHSPSNPFITGSVKSTEFGHLQGSWMPKGSRTLSMKNLGVGILQPAEPYTDSIIFKLSALLLALHNQPRDKAENTVGPPYPEIWERDLISKKGAKKKHMEEFGDSLHSASPYPLRFLPEEFQTGIGTRRSPLRSFLGRRQNVWESHVCRQRLPRKYLSSMLMLGSVLGSTMEKKLCSQPFLTEGSTMEICRSIQNLFGVPDELMEFSQSLLERGPRTVSQNSVKNYIQRHICCHKKRTPLKTWTRSSTSSIIRQYSGTRLGIKKTDSKLSQTFQEVPQQEPASCSGPQSPALVRPESTLGILYNMDDHPLSRKESKTSQNDSQARTCESLTANSLPLANTDISEQLNMLKELKLKVAAKLLRSQIPNNVPPPPSSGLVLKYPTCLKCGRWSGINCCHKFQSAFGPSLLIYPKLHLLRTPEGHGEVQCHLAFKVESGKRPQVSKYRRRNRAGPRKGTTLPPRQKPKTSNVASRSPALKRDFQSSSSPSAASVQGHIRQTQWGSRGVGAKTEAKDNKICQDGTRDKSRLRKSSPLKYPKKTTTKGPKTENTNLYKKSGMTKENPSRTRTDLSKNKSITSCQESTSSSKKQPEKSSKPKFIQLPFQGLRSKILQKSLRILHSFRQKFEDRTKPDNWCSSKNMHTKQTAKDSCPTRASTPVAKHRATGSIPKQEDKLQETSDQRTQAQQSKQVNALQPRPLQLQKTMISKRDVSIQDKDSSRAKKNYSDDIPISELKSNVGAEFQAQEKIVADSPLNKTLQSHFKEKRTQEEEHHGFFGERALCYKSERAHRSLSERTPRNVSEKRHYSPSQRKHSSPSERTLRSLPDRRHHSPAHQSLFKERGHSQSERRQSSPSQQSPWSPSRRSHQSPSGRNLCGPPERRGHSPSAKSPHSLSGRSQQSSSPQRCPSPSKSFYVNLTQRTGGSSLERTHGHLSEKTSSSPSGRKSHTSSERTPYLICNDTVHRPSSKLIRRPEQTHSSPSEPFSSHSERSQSSPTDIDTQLLWSRLYAQAGHESGSGSSWCHLAT
ncbi:uncharacterized protein C2orf16 homolog [Acomys russatus]|uniref:uncharacterized protein C2orf16 homolog n=1 Tax=Acomys russatus TaxID=60746 RepID=UPI0021E26321|nr:uncharacterized protein C2orf16 homolog [Acomys russatus]